MKKAIIAILVLFTQASMAQDLEECRNVAKLAIKAVTEQSVENLTPYLAEDFTIAGQKGSVAHVVLKQLVSQLNDPIVSFEETSLSNSAKGVELKYATQYERMGNKEATFIFNKENKLTELSLFKMEVKTMDSKAKVKKSSSKVIEMPFRLADQIILVDAFLDGEKRTFILDSGAPKLILNSQFITKKTEGQQVFSASKGVNGKLSNLDIHKIASFDFGGVQLNDEEVLTMDLSHLKDEHNIEMYGLIGYDLIKDYDLLFDYENQKLTLIDPESFEDYQQQNLTNSTLEVVPFKLKQHIPIIDVQVGNETLKMGIDSGAESNLFDNDLFATLGHSLESLKKDTLKGAGKNQKEVNKGKLSEMKIGDSSFKQTPIIFSDISHLNKGYKLNLDGIIGYPILSKQKTILSYKRQELVFVK